MEKRKRKSSSPAGSTDNTNEEGRRKPKADKPPHSVADEAPPTAGSSQSPFLEPPAKHPFFTPQVPGDKSQPIQLAYLRQLPLRTRREWDLLRNIQTAYKVKVLSPEIEDFNLAREKYESTANLHWDYDRLWASFSLNLGDDSYNIICRLEGIPFDSLVDETRPGTTCRFVWCGESNYDLDHILCDPQRFTGELTFGKSDHLRARFDNMPVFGDNSEPYFDWPNTMGKKQLRIHAKPASGPLSVTEYLTPIIEMWNRYNSEHPDQKTKQINSSEIATNEQSPNSSSHFRPRPLQPASTHRFLDGEHSPTTDQYLKENSAELDSIFGEDFEDSDFTELREAENQSSAGSPSLSLSEASEPLLLPPSPSELFGFEARTPPAEPLDPEHDIFAEVITGEDTHGNRERSKSGQNAPSTNTGTDEGQKDWIKNISGIYDISSRYVEEGWPDMHSNSSMMFYVDEQDDEVWGKFNLGIYYGLIQFNGSIKSLKPGTPLELRWRAWDQSDSYNFRSGRGKVTIGEDQKLQGRLRRLDNKHGMDFQGLRRPIPSHSQNARSGPVPSEFPYKEGWYRSPDEGPGFSCEHDYVETRLVY